jgi:branched-chain amino acid transport system substrate-binding protein
MSPRTASSSNRRAAGAVLAGVLALVAAACSGDDGETTAPTTTVVIPDVTELAADRTDDGVLKIGVLLPRSGPGGSIGEPLVEAVQTTIDSINDAGGVLGRPVRVAVRDEGVDQVTAELAVDDLVLDEEVDVIIGPGSSRLALAVAPSIVDAGVLACSPLATSILLSDLPDDGLFIRTIGSDRLQARAIARSVDGTGFRSVSLVFPDDLYGRTFGAAVRDALVERGLTVEGEHSYTSTSDDFTGVAQAVIADETPVIALIGGADNGSRLFASIQAAAETLAPRVVANDSIRDTDVQGIVSAEPPILARLTGVSLEPFGGAPTVREILGLADAAATPAFGAAAIDCVNLAAITAQLAGSDAPAAMAALVQSTTRGGTSCSAVPECFDLIDQGLDIDYDGPTGLLSLDENGDVIQAEFIDYTFDDTGRDTTTERFLIVGG